MSAYAAIVTGSRFQTISSLFSYNISGSQCRPLPSFSPVSSFPLSPSLFHCPQLYFFKIFYLLIFREKGREGERERNINVWLPLTCPSTGDLACNPGMCPDWESNWQLFDSQSSAQSTESHQPGPLSPALINTLSKSPGLVL